MPLLRRSALAAVLLLFAPAAAHAAGPSRDLVVRSVSSPPATVAPGATFSVTDVTGNRGSRRAGASSTRFYLSRDTRRDARDLLVGSRSVKGVAARRRARGSTTLRVPASAATGIYRLLACADGAGRVRERSERNNCRAAKGTIAVVQPPPAPPTALAAPVISTAAPAPATGSGGATSGGATPAVVQAVLTVFDAYVTESDADTEDAVFTVLRSGNVSAPVSATWSTVDGTATGASGDFVGATGTVSFAAGEIEKTVTIDVLDDLRVEPSEETFAISLSNPSGATIGDGSGAGTIVSDDVAAGLLLNEVNANITDSKDLLELRATREGSLDGTQILIKPTGQAVTLPPVQVSSGDLVVVHYNAPGLAPETTSKSQFPRSDENGYYDTAWDVPSTATTGIVHTHRVIEVRAPDGTYHDAVPFVHVGEEQVAAFPAAVQAIQAVEQWSPVDCLGEPCTYTSAQNVGAISADWSNAGTTPAGLSAYRVGGDDDNNADWLEGAQSFGLPNPE